MGYKHVNAGIKSMGEMATRLENGEVFWFNGDKLHFDKRLLTPFRCGSYVMGGGVWRKFAEMAVREETPWYENIPAKGVWCWVWDVESDTKVVTKVGFSKGGEYFTDGNRIDWCQAQPLSEKELKLYMGLLEVRDGNNTL